MKDSEGETMEEPKFVICPECGNEQGDMGRNVSCEICGFGPMPYHDDDGEVVDP